MMSQNEIELRPKLQREMAVMWLLNVDEVDQTALVLKGQPKQSYSRHLRAKDIIVSRITNNLIRTTKNVPDNSSC